MAIVFQDVYLLHDTIANNIRVGKPGARIEEIIAAAKAAQCHEFISALPDGYETMVGEGGNTLSGGEKQRISIARALIKNAPIVLLDETTSSLDADNEKEIHKALDALMKDKTVIVIAHRLNTIIRADQILVLDKGIISERGNHKELFGTKRMVCPYDFRADKGAGVEHYLMPQKMLTRKTEELAKASSSALVYCIAERSVLRILLPQ